jgi:hypothetical protein
MKEEPPMFDHADIIHRYTRAEALRNGVLIDVSPVAREAGIRYPVALTRAVWQRCFAVPPCVQCQDEAGQLLGCRLDARLYDPPRHPRAGGALRSPRTQR